MLPKKDISVRVSLCINCYIIMFVFSTWERDNAWSKPEYLVYIILSNLVIYCTLWHCLSYVQ